MRVHVLGLRLICEFFIFIITFQETVLLDCIWQDKLVQKDFNIDSEASGVATPITKPYNVTVTNGILEIRFYWAGKGTTRIPVRGVYGPLISAISVNSSK